VAAAVVVASTEAAALLSAVQPLPALLPAKALQAELGVTRAAAEAIMRQVPSVIIPGLRKSYCRRADVESLIERQTFSNHQVPTVGSR
jgi:hypothetical protein